MLADAAGVRASGDGAAAVAFLHLHHPRLWPSWWSWRRFAGLPPLAGAERLLTCGRAEAAPLAWLFGFAVALSLADEVVVAALGGATAKAVCREALRRARARHSCCHHCSGRLGSAAGACRRPSRIRGGCGGACHGGGGLVARDRGCRGAPNSIWRRVREAQQSDARALAALARYADRRGPAALGFFVAGIALVFAALAELRVGSLAGSRRRFAAEAPAVCAIAGAGLARIGRAADPRLARRPARLLALGLAGAVGLWGFAAPWRIRSAPSSCRSLAWWLSLAALPLVLRRASRPAATDATGTMPPLPRRVRWCGWVRALFLSARRGVAGLLLWSAFAGGFGVGAGAMAGFAGAGAAPVPAGLRHRDRDAGFRGRRPSPAAIGWTSVGYFARSRSRDERRDAFGNLLPLAEIGAFEAIGHGHAAAAAAGRAGSSGLGIQRLKRQQRMTTGWPSRWPTNRSSSRYPELSRKVYWVKPNGPGCPVESVT